MLARPGDDADSGVEDSGHGGADSGDLAGAAVVYGTHAGSDTGPALHVGGGICAWGAQLTGVEWGDGETVRVLRTHPRRDIRAVVATKWSGEDIAWYDQPWDGPYSTGLPVTVASPRGPLVEVTAGGEVAVVDEEHLLWSGEDEWVFRGEVAGVQLEERLVRLGEEERQVRFEKQIPCCQGVPGGGAVWWGGVWLAVVGVVRRRG